MRPSRLGIANARYREQRLMTTAVIRLTMLSRTPNFRSLVTATSKNSLLRAPTRPLFRDLLLFVG
jgi:hypothetical protein